MTLNADKCKVMNIDFKKNRHAFEPVIVDGKELSVVSSAKILGVTLFSDLTWNDHVNEAIRKANKRLYFLVLLEGAEVNPHDIINFYCTVVRPCMFSNIVRLFSIMLCPSILPTISSEYRRGR